MQLGDCDLGRSTGGLRLNRVKRLARALNTSSNETNGQSPQCDKETMNNSCKFDIQYVLLHEALVRSFAFVTEHLVSYPAEQNVSQGDTHVICSDKSKFGQPISARGKDELPDMDGNFQSYFYLYPSNIIW